jgi:sulfur carrier protein moaD adenylyltransferase
VGIVGSIQALEAIKVRLKIGSNLCGRLLLIDGLTMRVREMKLPV